MSNRGTPSPATILNRPCLGPRDGSVPCPEGRVTQQTRCPPCRSSWEAWRRPGTTARGYGAEWQAFSREQIAAEPWCHTRGGCPYPDAGTPTNPLTTDHATLGLVVCRRCNSAKQHVDRARD